MATLTGQLMLDNGDTVHFYVNEDGDISRWGNTVAVLGRSVGITERIAEAMAKS